MKLFISAFLLSNVIGQQTVGLPPPNTGNPFGNRPPIAATPNNPVLPGGGSIGGSPPVPVAPVPPVTVNHPHPPQPPITAARPAVMGFFGQDCTPAPGDYPDACPTTGQPLASTSGKIECVHNFDCCTCGKMECGTVVTPDCTGLICNGDSSCYGVRDISIIGGPSGADINCNGDLSCMETKITGKDISGILCSGDGSCAYSQFDLTCTDTRCVVNCVGDNSCEGDPTNPLLAARFVIRKTRGLYCSSHACRFGTYSLIDNEGGDVVCNAERACEGARLTINHPASIQCGGMFSCIDSTMLIINPRNGFSIDCSSAQACAGMKLEIIVTDPLITQFRSISCGSARSCEGLTASITKVVPPGTAIPPEGSRNLEIMEFNCGAHRSCGDAIFDLSQNVVFKSCGCAGGLTNACEGLLGVDSCKHGMQKLECAGTRCAGTIETITNPHPDFYLVCSDPGSCENLVVSVVIDRSANAPNRLGGVICATTNSCKGLRFFVLNSGITRIELGSVTCSGTGSCDGAAFVLRHADLPTPVTCSTDSCKTCSKFTDSRYEPCV